MPQKISNISSMNIIFAIIVVAIIGFAALAHYASDKVDNASDKVDNSTFLNQSRRTAELFILASPSYRTSNAYLEQINETACSDQCWKFSYKYLSGVGVYGPVLNVTEKNLKMHYIDIEVHGGNNVRSAIINGEWDELNQRFVTT